MLPGNKREVLLATCINDIGTAMFLDACALRVGIFSLKSTPGKEAMFYYDTIERWP
jgi:hypothetical protein